MFGAARQCEEFINENRRRKHVVRFCPRYSGFDLQLRQCRSLPGEGPVQRLPARAALHAWPRPEMARPSSALVNVRFLKPYRRAGGTSYHQSVIIRWNNLMQLPEFTRSTTLRWSSPAWPYLLWLWSELSASRYCGQPLIFLFLADVAAALVRLAAASRPLRVSRHHVAGRRRK